MKVCGFDTSPDGDYSATGQNEKILLIRLSNKTKNIQNRLSSVPSGARNVLRQTENTWLANKGCPVEPSTTHPVKQTAGQARPFRVHPSRQKDWRAGLRGDNINYIIFQRMIRDYPCGFVGMKRFVDESKGKNPSPAKAGTPL
jgi:hypothetical protein